MAGKVKPTFLDSSSAIGDEEEEKDDGDDVDDDDDDDDDDEELETPTAARFGNRATMEQLTVWRIIREPSIDVRLDAGGINEDEHVMLESVTEPRMLTH